MGRNAKMFPKKFFPQLKATMLRKELANIQHKRGETLFTYLDWFIHLQDSCSHLGILENLPVRVLHRWDDFDVEKNATLLF